MDNFTDAVVRVRWRVYDFDWMAVSSVRYDNSVVGFVICVVDTEMKGTVHKRVAYKDAIGTHRMNTAARLEARRDGLRDLLKTYEMLPYEKRDLKELIRLKKKLDSTIAGLRASGEGHYR